MPQSSMRKSSGMAAPNGGFPARTTAILASTSLRSNTRATRSTVPMAGISLPSGRPAILFTMLVERGCQLKASDAPVTAAFADELIGHLRQAVVKSRPPNEEPPRPPSAPAVHPTGIEPLKRPRDGGIDGI
ncbi:hypothetical protein MTBSS4_90156 [Magnetospirillum sp. SS-4]|nr:hypothetical protein MTBSS4_90156 [Magnetospirillum sp. SS-4]